MDPSPVRRRSLGPVLLCLALLAPLAAEDLAPPAVEAPPLDAAHAQWAAVLEQALRANGVDYAALRRDRGALESYLVQIAEAEQPSGKAERLAFFINAYNALTIDLVLRTLPDERERWADYSVREIDGFWSDYRYLVAGERRSLDAIEHEILRPLGDPRIHCAINCASRSCPPIAAEPYTAARIDEQLDAAARAFVNDPYQVRVEDGAIHVNEILDWFGKDFRAAGGVRAFLRRFSKRDALDAALQADASIRYWDYDWSLNLADADAETGGVED